MAEQILDQLLTADPDDFDARLLRARVCAARGDIDGTLREGRSALDIKGISGADAVRLGQMLQEFGDTELAAESYRHAIAADPGYAYAYLGLALVADASMDSNDLKLLERRIDDPRADDEERRKLCFGLGKIWDDLKDYDRAFEYFQRGSEATRSQYPYSFGSDRRTFDAIMELHNEDFFQQFAHLGNDDATPIFIVGLPRCGSTLTEQILATHPDIVGAGEIDGLARAVLERTELQGKWPLVALNEDVMRLAQRECETYIKRARSLLGTESRVTDKQLLNFILIGFIGVLLPNATIIECRRDFRDQCISMFQKDFSGGNYNWTYDLEDLGHYCGLYVELMNHWKAALPGRIYTARYETLIEQPESSVRAILDHCGLPFDEACLSFHETQRSVVTYSFSQVRKPLYSSSVGRWKNYAPHIEPLLNALPEDVDTDTLTGQS